MRCRASGRQSRICPRTLSGFSLAHGSLDGIAALRSADAGPVPELTKSETRIIFQFAMRIRSRLLERYPMRNVWSAGRRRPVTTGAGTPRKRSRRVLARLAKGGFASPLAPPGAPFSFRGNGKKGLRRARAASNRAGGALAKSGNQARWISACAGMSGVRGSIRTEHTLQRDEVELNRSSVIARSASDEAIRSSQEAGLLRGACHRAARSADPLARNDAGAALTLKATRSNPPRRSRTPSPPVPIARCRP
jgi:hypothetical protein